MGRALYTPMFVAPTQPVNTVRFIFLDARTRLLRRLGTGRPRDAVGALRVEAGRNPYDRELSNLIGELSTRSDQFRVWWGTHDVYVQRNVVKRFRQPYVGDLELAAEALPLSGDIGQTLVVYSAEPGSPADDSLDAGT